MMGYADDVGLDDSDYAALDKLLNLMQNKEEDNEHDIDDNKDEPTKDEPVQEDQEEVPNKEYTIHAHDVDSIVQLLQLKIAKDVSKPSDGIHSEPSGFCERLICVCEFGWKIFANMSKVQKSHYCTCF